MHDHTIRTPLRNYLRCRMEAESLFADEFVVSQGKARVDMVALSDEMLGIEIKGGFDNLSRLGEQASEYGQVFERMALVTTENHLPEARWLIPPWWELILAAEMPDGTISFRSIRTGQKNPAIQPEALAELLWHREAAMVLRMATRDILPTKFPRHLLWKKLVESLSASELLAYVRACLKARIRQESVQARHECGDLCQFCAIPLQSPQSPFDARVDEYIRLLG